MKRLHIFALITTLILYQGVQAQTDSVYTLDKCIEYAFSNSAATQNAILDQQIAKYKVKETTGYGLPQINAEANTMYNVQLQPMFLLNSNAARFGVPVSPGASPTDVTAIQNLFQLKASNTVTLNASQIIFDGSYLVGLQASKTYTELATKSITQSKIETVDKITKAFYLVLINEQRLKLLDANLSRLDSSLAQLKQVNQNGLAEGLDVNRLEVAYNNLKTDQLNVQNQIAVMYSLLKYQMGYPVEQNMTLNGTLEQLEGRLSSIANTQAGTFDYNARIDYSLLQTQKRLQELDFKNTRAASYPRLVAFGTAGMVDMQNDYFKLYSSKYYGYGFLGAKLSVPVFSGGSRYYKQQQSKLNIDKVQNNINMMENVIDLQIQQSQITLKNNLETIKSQKRNLDLAEQVIKVTKAKYTEGVGSNLEVIDAENSFKTAQTNYYNAVYDALVALIDYQKSTGTLYTE